MRNFWNTKYTSFQQVEPTPSCCVHTFPDGTHACTVSGLKPGWIKVTPDMAQAFQKWAQKGLLRPYTVIDLFPTAMNEPSYIVLDVPPGTHNVPSQFLLPI